MRISRCLPRCYGIEFWYTVWMSSSRCGAVLWFDEVDEAFSTQTCSRCNSRAGPKGRKDLGISGWQCAVCEAVHDRNVNAAHIVLAAGHRRLAEGILGP